MGRGLAINAQVTTPGGLGFRRGPLGGSFSPDMGRGYETDMVRSDWLGWLGYRWLGFFFFNFVCVF
ncbi:hypothetical protein Hanom_Chr01g00021931 [Helianthus anomalus]